MNRSSLFVELKNQMKKQRIKYATVAKRLDLSESSVKRIFASQNCSFKQFDQICDVVGINLEQLVSAANARNTHQYQWTPELESRLAENLEGFYFFRQLVIERDLNKAQAKLNLSAKETRQRLRELEDLGLIEVHAGDKIRFKNNGYLKLREGGPLQKKLYRDWLPDFVERSLHDSSENYKIQATSTKVSADLKKKFIEDYQQLVSALLKQAQTEKWINPSTQKNLTVATFFGPERIGDRKSPWLHPKASETLE